MLLAFCWFKQAVALVSHVGFHVALGNLCSSRTWVSTRGSVMLRLWHGLGLLQMVGFKASVQRTGARWRAQLRKQEESVSREVRARFQRFKRESCTQARCFKLSGFGHRPQAAGPIRVSVWGGAPPVSRLSALVTLCDEKLNFYPCIKTLIRFTHL